MDRSPGGAGGGVCAACGMSTVTPGMTSPAAARWHGMPEMRYQNLYVWNVLVAALDVMLTIAVIYGHGGYEVNPIAAAVIAHMGIPGAVGLKFGIILLVIIICEVVGRRDDRAGRGLAQAALAINSVPVVYTLGLLVVAAAQ